MNKLFQIIFLLFIAISCTNLNVKEETDYVKFIQTSDLASVEYTVKKIVKGDDKSWYTIGNRKILFSVTAYLKAGLDLSAVTKDDILVNLDEKSITLTLPHAKLLSLDIPVEKTQMEYEQYGLFRFKFSAEERNKLLSIGEKQIKEDNELMTKLFKDAEKSAELFFKQLLSKMGFITINVNFR